MEKQISYGDRKIVYDITGEGKTVLLLHGFGETRSVWDEQVKSLAEKFRVITPDLPGTGDSELIDDMSMEGMAEVIKTIIDKEQVAGELPTVIGHSMGGYILLALVEKYPDILRSFGLFHSSAFADSDEKIQARRKGIAFIKEHGPYEFLKTAAPKLFSDRSHELISNKIDQFISSLNNFSAESLVYYYEAMIRRPDRTNVLKTTHLPVLFVLGKMDTAIPFEDGLKLCHLPGKAYIDVLHHSGHMGMMEEIEKTNALLERFLTET